MLQRAGCPQPSFSDSTGALAMVIREVQAMIASASISTIIAGSMSAATCTIAVAGRTSPKNSRERAPTASQREMSVT